MFIIGLGNPGEKYKNNRHNAGRLVLQFIADRQGIEWKENKKLHALETNAKFDKSKAVFILPEGMMNNSGKSVASLIKSKKDLMGLVVLHDDLDLPLGSIKISFARGSGGHRGVESIMRALKTREFARVRLGISPATPSGKLKKPQGEKAVIDFILSNFKPAELTMLKKVSKTVEKALGTFAALGRERAMNLFN
ncbi:MAG: Peptidyl-tRNA hydrolase [Parcubacteria group bacterium GW2011_GWA2_42_18]|nr:MAG: Peptidyl-tRNA hydrolase [Parcubacteria group bacterium GW2011_GWA2_42_18]